MISGSDCPEHLKRVKFLIPRRPTVMTALPYLGGQVLVLALWLQCVLENEFLAGVCVSQTVWMQFVGALGTVRQTVNGPVGEVSFAVTLGLAFVVSSLMSLIALSVVILRRNRQIVSGWARLMTVCALWTGPLAAWLGLWIVGEIGQFAMVQSLLLVILDATLALTLAGWMFCVWETAAHDPVQNGDRMRSRAWLSVAALVTGYTVLFTVLNWGLWFNLRIPHGDSAMYEEHLWNLTHGRGFRSYLDQGLFLGEHIQVIHVLLLPAYLCWPSHLLLELCESLALALGAVPVFLLALRASGSSRAGVLMALAYLFYFPVHYLDVSIDFKTFRPIAFGVPCLLWALAAMESRRWVSMTVCLVLALASKEDFAIVIAPLGLCLAGTSGWRAFKGREQDAWRPVAAGLLMCLLASTYLWLAVKILIPWFRDGETVHYARYFSAFGETPSEIVWKMVTSPGLLVTHLLTVGSVIYFVQMLLPIGFPWRSFGRLVVGAPLFALLCLNELAQQTPGPVHHFHAPLVPIVIWSACATLTLRPSAQPATDEMSRAVSGARWAASCAIATAMLFSFSPASLRFWDHGRVTYWRNAYVPDERARQFEKILPLIPQNARVASTDFVHPRFTHCERSYDYSNYPRKVADYLPKVPDDTEYIVIDTRHPYSEVREPTEVRELRLEPENWELLPDSTNGYFIVLQRKQEPNSLPSEPD